MKFVFQPGETKSNVLSSFYTIYQGIALPDDFPNMGTLTFQAAGGKADADFVDTDHTLDSSAAPNYLEFSLVAPFVRITSTVAAPAGSETEVPVVGII